MKMVFIFPDRKYKSIWRMPRLKKAMKDVAWRRYVSGRCLATFDPEISEWGNPATSVVTVQIMYGVHPGK